MSFQVFDYRTDITNMLVTPQIRSRFLKMAVGQENASHTHDLGHEIFLILQGQAEFEIAGHKEVVGPGQLCIALTDEPHIVRNVGDDEVIMYLSVTPHIQPTHTMWNDDGTKKPPRFAPNTNYDVALDRTTPTEELADRHLAEMETLAQMVEETIQVQQTQIDTFKQALDAGDKTAALQARDAMWEALYGMYRQVYTMSDAWNEFTSRTADEEAWK